MTEGRRVQFVVKTSKHCNLRCQYCYEYAELGNKERMSLEQLEQAYAHIASWYKQFEQPTLIEFDWHGGEPLLLPPDYYWRTFEAQRRILVDSAFSVRNVVQTNLTVLDENRLRLLKEGFHGVGVSIDLFGGLRVNGRGVDSVEKVLANLDRLRANNIAFGCITVLTKANLSAIPKIIKFYGTLNVPSVRFLRLFDGAYEDQHRGYEITLDEVISGFQTVFEELLLRDTGMRVEPIHRYVNQVIHHHTPGAIPTFYNKREWESIYIIDVNGDLYSYADAYDPRFCHGNIFQHSMQEIVLSAGHERAIAAAEQRMASVCHTCRFHGSCDGYPVAEEVSRFEPLDRGKAECVVEKAVLRYIERRLMEMGVINPITGTVNFPGPRATFTHIETLPLQAGVRIHIPDEDVSDLGQRVMLSSGTTADVDPPSDGLIYMKAALVPKEPWRRLTPAESELLRAKNSADQWDIGRDVAVIRIPEDVIAPLEGIFEEFGTRVALDAERYRVHTDHPAWDAAYSWLVEYLQQHYGLREHVPQIVKLATAPPGMKTVTKDGVVGESNPYYVGMHLDSWTKTPLTSRHESQNRICVNLGREERHLLFMNLTLIQMFEALGRSAPEDLERDYFGLDVGHDFMKAFPAYPVVRLRIAPREAYIAPTDNFIHDGSSVGTRYPDIGMHVLGYFGLKA